MPSIYGPEAKAEIELWHGHRLMGVDSSLARLPNSAQLWEQFGVVEASKQLGSSGAGYPEGRMSVIYDLVNRVGLDGRLEPSRLGEVDLAIAQLARAKPGDVTINGRLLHG
jgi:hypothetical protein